MAIATLKGACLTVAAFIAALCSQAEHLTVDDRIQDVLRHPAFAGHGRLVLPWDNRGYDEQMALRRIASLLPYHSHVEPSVVVEALNRMDGRQHRLSRPSTLRW